MSDSKEYQWTGASGADWRYGPSPWARDYYEARFTISEEWQKAFERVVGAVSRERAAAESALTEQQLIEALKQALACGDFRRLVTVDGNRQGVLYAPYQECERLRARIRELEEMLKAVRKALDPFDNELR